MKMDLKDHLQQERKAYIIPADLAVIDINAIDVICQSNGTESYTNNDDLDWFN